MEAAESIGPHGLVGAGGIEPPNDGVKVRCLTAWLRPNAPPRFQQGERRNPAKAPGRSRLDQYKVIPRWTNRPRGILSKC
jgi:hypothetical protein